MGEQTTSTRTLAKFCADVKYEDLPEEVVHKTKQILVDVIGLGLGARGEDLEKGKHGVKMAMMFQGAPQASILGTGEKVDVATAAFANGELMHSMDWCILLAPGHVSPFCVPSILALAEDRKASGKDVLLATALAHDITSRIGVSMGNFRTAVTQKLKSFGHGCNTFGAAVGAGKILGLGERQFLDCIGHAGYLAPVPSHEHYFFLPQGCFEKYGPAGWMAQGGIYSALLAEMGERSDWDVLDGDTGFWAMNGSNSVDYDAMLKNLGKEWFIMRAKHKPYPTDGMFQPSIFTLLQMMEEYDITAKDMDHIHCKIERLCMHPKFVNLNIENHIDACFSLQYCISVAAHGIPVSPAWQAERNVRNPEILDFMNRVTYEEYDRCEEARHLDLEVEGLSYINRRPSCVEITLKDGRKLVKENDYCIWMSSETPGYAATDEGLYKKYRSCTDTILDSAQADQAYDMIMHLEKVEDINDLIQLLIRKDY